MRLKVAERHTKSDSTLDDIQVLLRCHKQLTGDKAFEKHVFRAKFDEVSRSINEIHVQYAVMTERQTYSCCFVDFLQCD
jgi:hypothetical protein